MGGGERGRERGERVRGGLVEDQGRGRKGSELCEGGGKGLERSVTEWSSGAMNRDQ